MFAPSLEDVVDDTPKDENIYATTQQGERVPITPFWMKQLANNLSKKMSVTIKKGKGWASDVSKKELIYADSAMELTPDEITGLMLHEIAHIRHTTPLENKDKYPLTKEQPVTTQSSVNAIEDLRIELEIGKEYRGGAQMLQMVNGTLSQAVKERMEEFNKRAMSRLADSGMSPMDWRRGSSGAGMPPTDEIMMMALGLARGVPVPKEWYIPEAIQVARKIAGQLTPQKLESMKTTEDVYKYYEETVEPLLRPFYLPGQEDNKDKRGGCGHGTCGKDVEKPDRYSTEQDSVDKKIKDIVKQKTGGDGVSTDIERGRYRLPNYHKAKLFTRELFRQYLAQFKRALQDNAREEFVGKYRSGRLDERRLYKHRTGDIKLFQRKKEETVKSYFFTIALDISGSMLSGSRAKDMDYASVLLMELLTDCKIPHSVYLYNGTLYTAKKVQDVDKRTIEKQFNLAIGQCGGSTRLAPALVEMQKDLNASSADKKVAIVLTDGSFCELDNLALAQFLKRNSSDVATWGVGIETPWVERVFGPKNSIVTVKDEPVVGAFIRILSHYFASR